MSGFSGVMKGGWHPKGKDGGKESWRGDFKGIDQVAGWMGKEKRKGSETGGGSEHISRPLASLKDPSAFGPPPKNVNFHGGAALPTEITPDRRGLGAPLSHTQIAEAEQVVHTPQMEDEEETRAAGPPVPYRADRTGLKTNHYPPPPTHRTIDGSVSTTQVGQASQKANPSLPPRLPPRQNSSNVATPIAPSPAPPTYQVATQELSATKGGLNQNAATRLGKAGISVPGLGIGEPNPWKAERSPSNNPTTSAGPQLSELQSRFSRMNTGSPKADATPPAEGTTIAQKQAAFKTAQDFHKDPSTVTLADAKGAATTANNFRERHQEQISAGAQKANGWNKKYNLTGRMNSFLEQQVSPASEQQATSVVPQVPSPAPSDSSALSSRKPPPPPPPKKPAGMHAQPAAAHAPPPVPLGTKPSFG